MEYKIVAIGSLDTTQDYVIVDKGDNEFESFPVDETNPRYLQFLEETK